MAKRKKSTTPARSKSGTALSGKGKTLVMVESPTKAHTLKKMLGSKYLVKARLFG